ncbi:MAG: Re/Si-specific NAD(P)(+) transhydrogenase subunit alpha [Alphaproteobacteria bacterium]
MRVAVLKERRKGEARVAATPDTIKKMIDMGMTVAVEKGAGEGSSITDAAYKDAGATIAAKADTALKGADVVLKVRRPMTEKEAGVEELENLPDGCALISILDILTKTEQAKTFAKKKVNAFALEMVPRITRAQNMDVLSSQSNLAGYRAVIDASHEISTAFPMMMTAAGTVPPVKTLILGAGVAGLQAIATARRLGSIVHAFDVRKAAKEQVESLGASFVEVEDDADAETEGGYAKEMSEDYKKRQAAKIEESVAKSNVVITTALIPGKPAPKLITAAMVEKMKHGSVIVDMATSAGGNVEGSEVDKIVTTKNGVKIIGYANIPSRISGNASALYAKNILNFLTLLYDKEAKAINVNMEDEIIASTLVKE